MPESFTRHLNDFSKDFYKLGESQTRKKNVRSLAERYQMTFIGRGSESAVISFKDTEDKVIAFNFNDTKDMKEIFYLQRMFSTLFPYNFPKFYAAFFKNDERQIMPGTIRHKIPKRFGAMQNTFEYKQTVRYPFKDAMAEIRNMGVIAEFDTFKGNFDVGQDGGEYYLDVSYLKWKTLNKDQVAYYMEKNRRQDGKYYTDYDKRVVLKSIDRLKEIGAIY